MLEANVTKFRQMIKLFRNIRKPFLMENPTSAKASAKAGKYLAYAFGEIVLVVIGILIALQINNWNLNRLASIEEKSILKNLNTEFKINRTFLLSDLEKKIAV